ncbi:MAG: dihydroorotate dehydrogenase [Nitrospirota bacterium]
MWFLYYWKLCIHLLFGTKRIGVNNKWQESFDSIFNIPLFGFGYSILIRPIRWRILCKILRLRMEIAGIGRDSIRGANRSVSMKQSCRPIGADKNENMGVSLDPLSDSVQRTHPRILESYSSPDLSVNIAGIRFKNPVIAASGTFGYGEEYGKLIDLNRIGGIAVKGLSLQPREGNIPPRICETPSGMLNAIGLANVGIDLFLSEKLPFLRRFDTRIIVNISGENIDEFIEIAKRLNREDGIDAIEVNISCPNVKKGGMQFGRDTKETYRVVSGVRKAADIPIIVKLSPNVTDIVEFAKTSKDAGADAVSLVNTFLGMSIDIETRMPKLANITGGLSGPAIRPIAVRMVWEVANNVEIPIIGIGGIVSPEDAIEFILAGAAAIEVGTANFIAPDSIIKVIDGIRDYMEKNKVRDIKSLIKGVKICQ